jgi:hypothetical protein
MSLIQPREQILLGFVGSPLPPALNCDPFISKIGGIPVIHYLSKTKEKKQKFSLLDVETFCFVIRSRYRKRPQYLNKCVRIVSRRCI